MTSPSGKPSFLCGEAKFLLLPSHHRSGEGSASSEPSLPQAGGAQRGCQGSFPAVSGCCSTGGGGAAAGGRGSVKQGANVGLD